MLCFKIEVWCTLFIKRSRSLLLIKYIWYCWYYRDNIVVIRGILNKKIVKDRANWGLLSKLWAKLLYFKVYLNILNTFFIWWSPPDDVCSRNQPCTVVSILTGPDIPWSSFPGAVSSIFQRLRYGQNSIFFMWNIFNWPCQMTCHGLPFYCFW